MDTDRAIRLARAILECIGDDPDREGLVDTPRRVAQAWTEIFAGYTTDPKSVLKTFPAADEEPSGLVWVENIPFYSMCEHHMLPFHGTATVAYLPVTYEPTRYGQRGENRVIGLSKIPRAVQLCAKRLQLQERLTRQIANTISSAAAGAGALVRSQHLCLAMRGAEVRESTMVTTALAGDLQVSPWREEFQGRVR